MHFVILSTCSGKLKESDFPHDKHPKRKILISDSAEGKEFSFIKKYIFADEQLVFTRKLLRVNKVYLGYVFKPHPTDLHT